MRRKVRLLVLFMSDEKEMRRWKALSDELSATGSAVEADPLDAPRP